MKLNSPFLLLFFLGLLFSCTTNDKHTVQQSDAETALHDYAEQLVKDSLLVDKVQHIEKAVKLANQSNNTALHYQSVLDKLDYIIIPNHPDSVSFYFDQLSDLATKKENPMASSAYVLSKKGNYSFLLKDYRKAYGFYDAAKKIFQKEKDSLQTSFNLLKMSEIQQIYNDYSESEETITEALKLLEHIKDPYAVFFLLEAYNKLGISYTGLKNYSEAIHYYKKAIALTKDPLSKKMIENNIGLIYLEQGHYNKAINSFQLLEQAAIVKTDSSFFSKVLDNLGFSKFKSDGSSGKELMKKALVIRSELRDEKGMVYSYLNLSKYYGTKNPVLATNYAQKAYGMATKVGAIDNRLKALELLATYGAKNYNQQYFRLNDSVNDFRRVAKNEFAKMRYDFQNDRNEKLAREKEQAETKVAYLIVGITMGIIILAGIILYILAQIKHRKEKRIEGYKAETRIAKKLHDELANDIFNTMTFAEIKDLSAPENKETLLDNLDKIYTQTRNISKENNNIDMGQKYSSHLKEMLSGYGSEEVNIIINEIDNIDWKTIESTKKIVVYRVLQELLVNMKKHSKANVVLIGFKKVDKKIQINYSDNGVGMGHDEHLRKNGLQNVENRIQSINGTITFDPTPEKGFKVNFSFNS